jgi:hypothetical protein
MAVLIMLLDVGTVSDISEMEAASIFSSYIEYNLSLVLSSVKSYPCNKPWKPIGL